MELVLADWIHDYVNLSPGSCDLNDYADKFGTNHDVGLHVKIICEGFSKYETSIAVSFINTTERIFRQVQTIIDITTDFKIFCMEMDSYIQHCSPLPNELFIYDSLTFHVDILSLEHKYDQTDGEPIRIISPDYRIGLEIDRMYYDGLIPLSVVAVLGQIHPVHYQNYPNVFHPSFHIRKLSATDFDINTILPNEVEKNTEYSDVYVSLPDFNANYLIPKDSQSLYKPSRFPQHLFITSILSSTCSYEEIFQYCIDSISFY